MKPTPLRYHRKKGVAIIAVLMFIVMLAGLAYEIWLYASVDYGLFGTSLDQYQAELNARSGLELSLWRLSIYQRLSQEARRNGQSSFEAYLNALWQIPIQWPIHTPEVSQELKSLSSHWPGGFQAQIEDEGSKIDVNDLGYPDPTIGQSTRSLLIALMQEWALKDESWNELLKETPPTKIVDRLTDWIDSDKTALPDGYESEENLNRYFQNPFEILTVKSLPLAILEKLNSILTCYGQRGINPNTAPESILKILDRSFDDEIVKAILQRRQDPIRGGPFQNAQDFWTFVSTQGARITPEKQGLVPLAFDPVSSFHITVTGYYKQKSVTWDVYVWDYQKSVQNLADRVSQNILRNFNLTPKVQNGAPGPSQGSWPIVYWRQR